MITPILVGAIIGTLLIFLGFIALLSQKIYIDHRTNKATEIDVPILGKMKANYPALVFVFLGSAIVVFGLNKYTPPVSTSSWTIEGTITSATPILNSDWQSGKLQVAPIFDGNITPTDPTTTTSIAGKFKFNIDIPEGKSAEDVISTIEYANAAGNMSINPKAELENRNSGKLSLLKDATTMRLRDYDVPLVLYPKQPN
ncbi:MAG TPA: hypothetical protein VNF48_04365 [Gammaproteobacteria bacterium]|nr:hypothetical protein [Gammaproteobacteria bacterium]